jgi:hypothetical protein
MQAKLAAVALLALLCLQTTEAVLKQADGGGVEAQCDTTLPWEFKVSRQGGIAAGRYLKISYSFLGERDAARNAVPDVPGTPIPFFHSVPISNPLLASYINVETSATADFAYMGFGAAGIPQSTNPDRFFDGFVLNLLARRQFNCDSYMLPINGVNTKVCFAGLQSDNTTCVPHTVPAGTLKMSVAVNKWNWASTGVYWAVGFDISPVGFTNPSIGYLNDVMNSEFLTLNYTDTDGFFIDVKVNKKFNRGDNTFAYGSPVYTRNGNDVTVRIDVARSQLLNNGAGWFLYDPEVNVRTNNGQGLSSAATTGASFFLITALVALVGYLF